MWSLSANQRPGLGEEGERDELSCGELYQNIITAIPATLWPNRTWQSVLCIFKMNMFMFVLIKNRLFMWNLPFSFSWKLLTLASLTVYLLLVRCGRMRAEAWRHENTRLSLVEITTSLIGRKVRTSSRDGNPNQRIHQEWYRYQVQFT